MRVDEERAKTPLEASGGRLEVEIDICQYGTVSSRVALVIMICLAYDVIHNLNVRLY
jgi:hypothetical protein